MKVKGGWGGGLESFGCAALVLFKLKQNNVFGYRELPKWKPDKTEKDVVGWRGKKSKNFGETLDKEMLLLAQSAIFASMHFKKKKKHFHNINDSCSL